MARKTNHKPRSKGHRLASYTKALRRSLSAATPQNGASGSHGILGGRECLAQQPSGYFLRAAFLRFGGGRSASRGNGTVASATSLMRSQIIAPSASRSR
jgi:hypothetical protein